MYSALLFVHIVGAVFTGVISLAALTVAASGNARWYRGVALGLSSLAAFEVATGVALSVLSPNVTALSLCGNIALYLSFVAVVEFILYSRLRKTSRPFPAVSVLAPITASVALLGTAIVMGA